MFYVFVITGVTLTVPEGAIKKGQTEELFLAICRDDKDRPKLSGSFFFGSTFFCKIKYIYIDLSYD